MDPISAASTTAATLHNLVTSVPPGGSQRHRARQERQAWYRGLQRATHEAVTWAGHLRLLQEVNRDLEPAEIATNNAKITDFMAALDALRLIGNPGPRTAGEEMTSLLGALSGMVGVTRPIPRRRTALSLADSNEVAKRAVEVVPVLASAIEQVRANKDAWDAASARFAVVQQALGHANRAFTLAARDDLGRGRKWWHVGNSERRRWWQLWRQPKQWPGGFPAASADDLINRYQSEVTEVQPD